MRSRPSTETECDTGRTPVEPQRPRLLSHVRWTLLGTAASAAGSWAIVIILARSSGPAAVGVYAFALALTAPVLSFTGLQLRTLLATDARSSYGFGEYRKLTFLTTAVGVAGSLVIGWAAGREAAAWSVLVPVCLMRAADAVSQIYWGLWQQRERMKVIGVGRLLQAVVSVVLVAVACRFGAGAAGAATSAALGSAALLAFMHVRTTKDDELRPAMTHGSAAASWRRLGRLATTGLPLGIILLLEALQVNVPRYFIEREAGQTALGLFAAASQLTTSGQLLVGAIGSAVVPRLASWHATGNPAFTRLTRRLVLVGVGLGAAGILLSALVGREVLALVYNPEFGQAADMLVVLSVAAGFGFAASLLGYALTASRIIAVQPIILTIALLVIVAFCAFLVPRLGAIGVAWALVAGSAAQAIVSGLALRRWRIAGVALSR